MFFRISHLLIFFFPVCLFAQSKIEVGVSLGSSNHLGDTQSESLYARGTTLSYDICARYPLNEMLFLKANYFGTRLSGDETRFKEAWHKARGFKYSNQLHEIGLSLEWDILAKMYAKRQDEVFQRRLSPYIFAGFALNSIKFDVDYNLIDGINAVTPIDQINKDLAQRMTKCLAIPVGAGVKFGLSPSLYVNMEACLRKTNSDYLDGISFAGNPLKKDWYGSLAVGINYRFLEVDDDHDGVSNKRDMCPNEVGSKFTKGCPDTDEDGIADKDDRCPDEYGLENLAGCPDQDDDEIADIDDLCPNTPGEKTLAGCPDSDKDGVVDALDKCPDVPGKLRGCPDTDKDGVADKDDLCPDVAGKVKGCPDQDADGVADKDDKCPTVFGLKTNKGCPIIDTDEDGIEDKLDKCPTEKGVAAYNGCPVPDADKDGVADKDDKCPTVFGLALFGGCPDTDADGVEDAKDLCPTIFGSGAKGCPNTTEIAALRAKDKKNTIAQNDKEAPSKVVSNKAETEMQNKILSEKMTNVKKIETAEESTFEEVKLAIDLSAKKIKFASNADILIKNSYPELNRIAKILKTYSNYSLDINGYTDNVGNDEKNKVLSKNRAKRCYDYLVLKGISKNRLTYQGFGKIQPITTNDTPEGRSENRRVEFKLK
jgi:OmpA-OmpF porin, OOP family